MGHQGSDHKAVNKPIVKLQRQEKSIDWHNAIMKTIENKQIL